jgi:PKD repeat protein
LVEIDELEIYYDTLCNGDSKIRAATYGRGLWESDLSDPGTLAPVACFTTSETTVCEGATVTLSDNSSFGPTAWAWIFSPATVTYTGSTDSSSQNPQVIFDAAGSYSITLQATNANGNDSEVKSAYITVEAAMTLPASEDFEGTGLCGTTSDCGSTACTISSTSWSNVTNGVDDDIDWRTDEGGTPSSNTGPSVDYNPGTASGNYVYTEASGGCTGQEAILLSDCIDLTSATDADVSFAYHMYGADMGTLYVDVYTGGAWTNAIWSESGDQGNTWNTQTVNLVAYVGDVIKLRFRGVTGSDFTSDMALDDIEITTQTVLPIAGVVLSGTHVEDVGNVLTWEIISTDVIEGVTLERLNDGSVFEIISDVMSLTENGQNRYVDDSPGNGTSYYRLRLALENVATKYSNTVAITAVAMSHFTVQPNPFTDLLNISVSDPAGGEVVMMDAHGREVRRVVLPAEPTEAQVSTADLPAGVYFIRWRDEVVKVVK